MPELPEVETTCLGLSKVLLGARVLKVEVNRADLRLPIPTRLPEKLKGRTVKAVYRRAKYIVMTLDDGHALLLHLGMSGRLVVGDPDEARAKHDHVVLHCDGNRTLRFNDPRRFGMLDLCPVAALDGHPLIKDLGVEPLGKKLTAGYLGKKFSGRKMPIKSALLDQRIIAGLGNIYVSEALFHAGIRPTRLAGTLEPAELAALVQAIRKVLRAALKAGGSSLRDYVQSDGELGYFQNQFAVYDRENRSCPGCSCGKAAITRVVQSGRASFYCPYRQV